MGLDISLLVPWLFTWHLTSMCPKTHFFFNHAKALPEPKCTQWHWQHLSTILKALNQRIEYWSIGWALNASHRKRVHWLDYLLLLLLCIKLLCIYQCMNWHTFLFYFQVWVWHNNSFSALYPMMCLWVKVASRSSTVVSETVSDEFNGPKMAWHLVRTH